MSSEASLAEIGFYRCFNLRLVLDSTLPVNRRTAYYEYYESVNGTTDPREGLLKSVTNIDGLTLTYDYTETVPHRVSSVVISNNGTVFGGRRYEYKDLKECI